MSVSDCCLGSSGCCLFYVKPLFFFRGRCVFCCFKPFTTRPVFGFLFASPFFLCSVGSVDAVFFFFFLSGAGEPQTFLVWVSPCVLFFLHADYDYDPYFLLLTYTKATPRTCFSFFSSDVVRLWLVVVALVFFFSLSLSLSLGGSVAR